MGHIVETWKRFCKFVQSGVNVNGEDFYELDKEEYFKASDSAIGRYTILRIISYIKKTTAGFTSDGVFLSIFVR